jgi:SAM-dependent methyltransferase
MTCHYPDSGHDWCAAVEDRSFWFRHRNRFLLEVMRRYPPATPLYDVGGGNGAVAAALCDAGIPSIVVEPGEAGARRARERGLESICATLETAGLAPGSVPSMGLFDVIEHVEDDVGFLKAARRLMQPGGRVYVAVPAYETLWSAEDNYAHHFRRYTRRRLARELAAAGFDVQYATYMFALLPLPILLMRAIPYRLGMARPFTAEGVQADHAVGGTARALIDGLHAMELAVLRTLGGLPFGASVVAVAKNPAGDR